MQPTLCSKCKKNVAVVFISRMNEKNEMVNEGLCLQCAAKLGLPQVEDMMKRMGITPEDLPLVFDMGYTGQNGRRDRQSSGIGLYLCRRICRNLRHDIAITSRVGEGTTVRITLGRPEFVAE